MTDVTGLKRTLGTYSQCLGALLCLAVVPFANLHFLIEVTLTTGEILCPPPLPLQELNPWPDVIRN